MVLDLLLVHLCRKERLKLSLETPLPASAAISGKADYTLWSGDDLVAVVEAKRCVRTGGVTEARDSRATLLTNALAQTCALLQGFHTAGKRPLGIVSDAKGWLLVRVEDGAPVLQLWPSHQTMMELRGGNDLANLIGCLRQIISRS